MAQNNFKRNYLMPLHFKGLIYEESVNFIAKFSSHFTLLLLLFAADNGDND